MKLVHCETYQGAVAAVHIEQATRELYGPGNQTSETEVISPIVIMHFGEATFLSPVSSIHDAIAAAKIRIEHENRSYVNHVLRDRVPTAQAIQHFQDCGIPLEIVPPLPESAPYYPAFPSPLYQNLLAYDLACANKSRRVEDTNNPSR